METFIFLKMKTLKCPSRMDPSITQPRKDRARAALSARGNATKTRFAGFETKQCPADTRPGSPVVPQTSTGEL